MLTELLPQILIMPQLRHAKKSAARPQRVPVPQIGGVGVARQARRDIGMLEEPSRRPQQHRRLLAEEAEQGITELFPVFGAEALHASDGLLRLGLCGTRS